jgi:hypothetical protein
MSFSLGSPQPFRIFLSIGSSNIVFLYHLENFLSMVFSMDSFMSLVGETKNSLKSYFTPLCINSPRHASGYILLYLYKKKNHHPI